MSGFLTRNLRPSAPLTVQSLPSFARQALVELGVVFGINPPARERGFSGSLKSSCFVFFSFGKQVVCFFDFSWL